MLPRSIVLKCILWFRSDYHSLNGEVPCYYQIKSEFRITCFLFFKRHYNLNKQKSRIHTICYLLDHKFRYTTHYHLSLSNAKFYTYTNTHESFCTFLKNSNHPFAGTQSWVCWCHFSTLKFTSSATSPWIIVTVTFNYINNIQAFRNCSNEPQLPFLILVKWLRSPGYLCLK